MSSHQGFLIASPEYNSSISGVLKNMIDWTSRQSEGEEPLVCYKGKVAGLMSASPGKLGGLRGLVHVRSILENMGVLIIPNQTTISQSDEAFDSDDVLRDPKQEQKAKNVGSDLAQILLKLNT
jgi:NAD(P)H-dependent FMN reductase